MKPVKLAAAGTAMVLSLTSVAFAQPRDDQRQPPGAHQPGGSPQQGQPHGPQQHGPQHSPQQPQGPQQQRPQAHHPAPGPAGGPVARGAGPGHQLHRGDRLPKDFRNRQYVVDDWRAHHLSAPPRGHHWVQVGADYVLVAVATGVITALILGGN